MNGSANLAVLGVGDWHIAVGAGNIRLGRAGACRRALCAGLPCPTSVQADTILYINAAPRWLDKAEDGCELRYGEDEPGLTLRPGYSSALGGGAKDCCTVKKRWKNA